MLVYCFFEPKKPVSIASAVLCSGLTNEIQCLIVITRKDLALRTKTNQQASSKENRMEVRLVTAASRGFFFSLSRGSRSRLRRSQSQLRYKKKNPLAPRVTGHEIVLEIKEQGKQTRTIQAHV